MIYIRKRPLDIPATFTLADGTERAGSGANVTGILFGDAAADRVVLTYCITSDVLLTAATLGGVSAEFVQADIGSSRIAIVWAPIAAGTSGTLNLTGPTPLFNFGAARMTGINPTYHDVDAAIASSVNVDTTAGGVLIGVSVRTPAATITWGGGMTEDFDYTGAGGAAGLSMAHLVPTVAATPTAITTTTAGVVMGISFAKAA